MPNLCDSLWTMLRTHSRSLFFDSALVVVVVDWVLAVQLPAVLLPSPHRLLLLVVLLLQLPPLPCSNPPAAVCFLELVLPLHREWPLVPVVPLHTARLALWRDPLAAVAVRLLPSNPKSFRRNSPSRANSWEPVLKTSKCSTNACKSTRVINRHAPSCTSNSRLVSAATTKCLSTKCCAVLP